MELIEHEGNRLIAMTRDEFLEIAKPYICLGKEYKKDLEMQKACIQKLQLDLDFEKQKIEQVKKEKYIPISNVMKYLRIK